MSGYSVHVDKEGKWHWHYVHEGTIIAKSAEKHDNPDACQKEIEIIKASEFAPIMQIGRYFPGDDE